MRRSLTFWVGVLALGMVVPQAIGLKLLPMTLEERVERAELIVIGSVESMVAQEAPERGLAGRDAVVKLAVGEILKGDCDAKQLTVYLEFPLSGSGPKGKVMWLLRRDPEDRWIIDRPDMMLPKGWKDKVADILEQQSPK